MAKSFQVCFLIVLATANLISAQMSFQEAVCTDLSSCSVAETHMEQSHVNLYRDILPCTREANVQCNFGYQMVQNDGLVFSDLDDNTLFCYNGVLYGSKCVVPEPMCMTPVSETFTTSCGDYFSGSCEASCSSGYEGVATPFVCTAGFTTGGPNCTATLSTCSVLASPIVENGQVICPSENGYVADGASCQLICNAGFDKFVQDSAGFTCTAGVFGTGPICIPKVESVTCMTPDPLAYRFLAGCQQGTFSGTCSATCALGYSSDSAYIAIECTRFGVQMTSTCVKIPVVVESCPLVLPPHSLSTNCTGNTVSKGQSCTVTCATGYSVIGRVGVCASGSILLQTCNPSPCVVVKPEHGSFTTSKCQSGTIQSGDFCVTQCDNSYFVSNSAATTGATRRPASTGPSVYCLNGVFNATSCVRQSQNTPASGNGRN